MNSLVISYKNHEWCHSWYLLDLQRLFDFIVRVSFFSISFFFFCGFYYLLRYWGKFLSTSNDSNSSNYSQNIWERLLFSCEIAHYGKSSISVFQEIFISNDKIFISGGGMSIRQKLFDVLRFSWYFLIS